MRKTVSTAFLAALIGVAIASSLGARAAHAATSGGSTAATAAKVTPGWECIPKKAGHAVLSGGTGAKPSCHHGNTAVLAPTYVKSGVGGRPTVKFASVNVQILSGSGSTSGAVNGEGNLVIGYAENPNHYVRTGSNNLIVGAGNGWQGYGSILGGFANRATAPYTIVFGTNNVAAAKFASVTGGQFNLASGLYSAIVGGCGNAAGNGGTLSTSGCLADAQAVLGGFEDTASGLESAVVGGALSTASGGSATVGGGQGNVASGGNSSITGGDFNEATGSFSAILGGFENSTSDFDSTVAGGESNTASANEASVLGGASNNASTNCQSIPPSPISSC